MIQDRAQGELTWFRTRAKAFYERLYTEMIEEVSPKLQQEAPPGTGKATVKITSHG